MDYHW